VRLDLKKKGTKKKMPIKVEKFFKNKKKRRRPPSRAAPIKGGPEALSPK